MCKLVAECIPYSSFNEKIAIIKKLERIAYLEVWEHFIYVRY